MTSKESPEVKGDDELDGTLKVGEIIGSLETVLGSVKNLVSLDVIREMQRWKKRAQAAEQKNWELSKEIEKLEQDVSMWQGRLRRVELRCERLKKGKKEGNKRERWSRAPFVFSYDEDSDDNRGDEDKSAVIHHEPSPQLQSFLRGNSFRGKWDRKRISGIEEEMDLSTVGESTLLARKYVKDYIKENPLKSPSSDGDDDEDLPRYIVSKKSFRNSQKSLDGEAQWMEI